MFLFLSRMANLCPTRKKWSGTRISPMCSSPRALPPLSIGELQVAGGGISSGTFNALARVLPVWVVASRAFAVPGHDADAIMVRSDLRDKVKGVADLRGRKVAASGIGSPSYLALGRALELEGLGIKDVELVNMPFPDMVTALAKRAIDAGSVAEPFITAIRERGLGFRLRGDGDYTPNRLGGWSSTTRTGPRRTQRWPPTS